MALTWISNEPVERKLKAYITIEKRLSPICLDGSASYYRPSFGWSVLSDGRL
nr:hypothetical protein P5645_09370 [Bacillus subtilis]